MKGLVLTVAILLGLAAPAWAGLAEGVAAYERGDYATALRELRPLAERGYSRAQGYLGFMYAEGEGVPRPPSSTQTDDAKRQQEEFQQMARDAGEAFQALNIALSNHLRGGGGPGEYFDLLEKQFVDAARVWKDARKLAGKDTSIVDRSLARALDAIPKR